MQILSAEQTRKADAYTIANEPIKSIDLMERASQAFVDWFTLKFNVNKDLLVIAGSGNNGGDALAIARILYEKKYHVEVYLASPQSQGSDDYAINLKRLPPEIKRIEQLDFNCDIIIDGIFGSGIARPIEGELGTLIDKINGSGKLIVSVDIASGLIPDGLPVEGSVIKPDFTVSFQLPKLAFMLPENSNNVGQWAMVDIGLDDAIITAQKTGYHYFNEDNTKGLLRPRLKFAHKGDFGHALIVGGSFGKIGANLLASKACLKTGAGLITSLVPNCGYPILQTAFPEAMCLVSGTNHLINFEVKNLSNYSTLGIGPGIGTNLETLSL
ncbi:NAD(P)H-hydrate epimerase / ADP-dependent (S)-NAD(P)H-hydrate dehydratase, partial [hydrothermal vent metagenome]